MADTSEWYEQILDLQLRTNPDRWRSLRAQGIDDGSELRLGFVYLAPGHAEAEQLVAFLREQTDYEVDARGQRSGRLHRRTWLVIGATQPAGITLEILDEWVQWMVAAGAAEGPCAFDGWVVVAGH